MQKKYLINFKKEKVKLVFVCGSGTSVAISTNKIKKLELLLDVTLNQPNCLVNVVFNILLGARLTKKRTLKKLFQFF